MKNINEYRSQKLMEIKDGDLSNLRQELDGLKIYLDGCAKSEIADTLDNILYKTEQVKVLEELLKEYE